MTGLKKQAGYSFIILGVLIIIYVLYINSRVSHETRTFSPYTVLSSSWEKYKTQFLNKDGRIIDSPQSGITTSEGQSYAMLRAVWLDDKTTFDLVWKWTRENLQKRGDNLFGWKWGKNSAGKYGFMDNGGNNSASDADTDIALSLLFAGQRWNNAVYTLEAKKIISDIWKTETVPVKGTHYQIAGNWANNSEEIIINPSYFAPYAWRIFAKADLQHDWNSIIIPGYVLLETATQDKLDKDSSVSLPPDWAAVDKKTGAVKPANLGNLSTDYSFDAVRVPWRIALDYQWNHTKEAQDYLQSNFQILENTYKNTGKLPSAFTHDGNVLDTNENPAMYATAIGFFLFNDKQTADRIYTDKIIKLYSNDTNSFNQNIPYYEQNWLWFGTALYNNYLKQLD